jgi:transposase
VAKETKMTLEATSLDVVADRGYFSGEEILACEQEGITVRAQCLCSSVFTQPSP